MTPQSEQVEEAARNYWLLNCIKRVLSPLETRSNDGQGPKGLLAIYEKPGDVGGALRFAAKSTLSAAWHHCISFIKRSVI